MDQRDLETSADLARHSAEVARLTAAAAKADSLRNAAWFGCLAGLVALLGLLSGNPEIKPYATPFLMAAIVGGVWLFIDRKSAPEDAEAIKRAIQYRDAAAGKLKDNVDGMSGER